MTVGDHARDLFQGCMALIAAVFILGGAILGTALGYRIVSRFFGM